MHLLLELSWHNEGYRKEAFVIVYSDTNYKM